MRYQIEYVPNPNMLALRFLCCLGHNAFFGMKSPREVGEHVPYDFILREWFAHGVTEISVLQLPGYLRVMIDKVPEKSWDELLPLLMPPSHSMRWEEVGKRIPPQMAAL